MHHEACPSCKSHQIEDFFLIKNAPVYSIVTVKSKAEALAVPRKDIGLGICQQCGFIFNRLYDTDTDYFTLGYEDQQGFSETFMKYLTRISNELISKYDLKGKTILEIGCGKGDFINLLNKLAGGIGIGVDPAYEDGRQSNQHLTFYKEYYSEKHGALNPDFICCRHTFEHIFHTYDFLRLIRMSLGQKKPVVFFEIPQINRILDIQAFWDIYYEHCSYFSAGSLGRLFRNAGFDVLDIRLDYSDQYLLIEAVPSDTPAEKTFPIEETVADQKVRIENFKTKINQQLSEWEKRLKQMKESGEKVVVWGGGSKSVGFLTQFSDLSLIDYVVDINPNMEGNYIPGIGSRYVQPEFLKDYQPDTVIIMNGVYQDEITKTMSAMGVNPKVYSL
ncbi:C-methyltransferase C-terminal domain-containing protein [Desulfuromusa kysingii]|uniref:C-methyltransferase C-terminal domain-containing protein n=1 Tax=Desulfuromusa kysingii TaxID=37625 RepID=A0A1H4B9P1_9BACT|nr:class I SAM-dependent methyltransferase [Desulfuromusa kysingii]SEA44851.1 C-methyltransferase C-terminal domain-containing protein [Desulfuromusa kysingii]